MKSAQQQNRKYIAITAAVALAMLLLLYALLGIIPFGGNTVLTGDLNGQYTSYYAHYKRVVTGQAGFAYGFDKGLGGNLLGLFAYYVSSPLHLLYLLVPVSAFGGMVGVVLGLKLVLACTAFSAFAYRKYPTLGFVGVPLALGYGFMAYTLVYAQNIMWHDVVILLPLVCGGVDRILEGKSPIPYILLLALAVVANFYIAFMLCIFIVLYFLYSVVQKGRQPFAALRKPLLGFVGGSVLGGGLSAVMLLPALANINTAKGQLLAYTFTWETQFPLYRLPERLVWGNFMWPDVIDGLPNIYCGALALLLAGCYFAAKKIPLREKLAAAGILLVLVLSFWVKGLDVVWHGLKAPVWFPYRYSYLFSFFVVFLGASAAGRGGLSKKALAISAGVLGAGFALMVLFPVGTSRSKVLLTLGALLAFGLVLFMRARPQKKWLGRALAVGLVGAVALELVGQGVYVTHQFEAYPDSEYRSFVANMQSTINAVHGQDTGTYRIEKTFYRSINDPMLIGYNGISHFGSTQDDAAVDALYAMGHRDTTLYGSGGTVFSDSLLGLKYILAEQDDYAPAHLQALSLNTPYTVYQNPYALPLAFAVPGAANAGEYGPVPQPEGDIFAYQNEMYRALTGGDEDIIYPVQSVRVVYNKTELPLVGYWPAGAVCTVSAEEAQPGYYYAVLHAPPQWDNLLLNGQDTGAPHVERVINLGLLNKGESVTLQWTNPEGMEVSQVQVGYIPLAAMEDLHRAAWQGAGQIVMEDGRIEADAVAQDGQVLFLAVGYDANWAATVNGQAVQAKAFGGFMAVPLQAGQNHVVLQYKVPLVLPGLCVTVVCALAVVALAVWPAVKKQRKKQASPKEN